jgi:DNA-directed RNA polymerase specialized sigma24 family protein
MLTWEGADAVGVRIKSGANTFMGKDMSVLTPQEREVLEWHYVGGWSPAEQAKHMEITEVEVELLRIDALMKLGLEEVIAQEEIRKRQA